MKVYLGLGTNLGDKEANLHTAVQQINMRIGKVTSLSALSLLLMGLLFRAFFPECCLLCRYFSFSL